ncbi:MAG: YlbF family regulator [Oscillospiraceae bacterium]|nr:YlbF family regulator [Oscillospiraceae bacterium]
MKIIELAREFAAKIQQTEEYAALEAAREANDGDSVLQDMIARFNVLGAAMEREADKESPDEALMDRLNVELTALYEEVMSNKNMANFSETKSLIDEEMNMAMEIVSAAINGEDPAVYEPHDHGECGCGCGGCHGC